LRPETTKNGEMQVAFSFSFSEIMDCATVTSSLVFDIGLLVAGSIKCKSEVAKIEPKIQPVLWTVEGILDNVPDGVITISVGKGAKTIDGRMITVSEVVSFS
jgi:hypothetical protein